MFSLTCSLNKRLNKQSWGWWFETPSRSLWRHCNDILGISHTLKRKCHYDELFVTGCSESYKKDNFLCTQGRKCHQIDDISLSMLYNQLQWQCIFQMIHPADIKCNHDVIITSKRCSCTFCRYKHVVIIASIRQTFHGTFLRVIEIRWKCICHFLLVTISITYISLLLSHHPDVGNFLTTMNCRNPLDLEYQSKIR